MAKKFVLIVLLVVLALGVAFWGQWYADKKRAETAVGKVLDLETQTFDLGKGVTLEMVRLPAGTFRMGSDDVAMSFLPGRTKPDTDEQPAHTVELSEFWIGKYEISQEQYEAVMGNNPSNFKGYKNPVEQISWDDAMAFCKALSNNTGTSFTLPTEAQWEYACRAGSTTVYCFGNNKSGLDDYAWYDKYSGAPHPVGQKMPNHWGLYDMHGNVWEWCLDWYDKDFYGTAAATMKNPENTKKADYRMLRGGGWGYRGGGCRSADRNVHPQDGRYNTDGFRIVQTQP